MSNETLNWALMSPPIAFRREFSEITGSLAAGVMLSQLLYWASRTSNPYGWIYKTQKEWEFETTISRRGQETARKKLVYLGIIEEKLMKVPARLHFRVNFNILNRLLEEHFKNVRNVQHSMAESAKLAGTNEPFSLLTKNTTKNTTESVSEDTHDDVQELVKYWNEQTGQDLRLSKKEMGPIYGIIKRETTERLKQAIKVAAREIKADEIRWTWGSILHKSSNIAQLVQRSGHRQSKEPEMSEKEREIYERMARKGQNRG